MLWHLSRGRGCYNTQEQQEQDLPDYYREEQCGKYLKPNCRSITMAVTRVKLVSLHEPEQIITGPPMGATQAN
jgi:hypothetical protein